jgi:hypothetical protein
VSTKVKSTSPEASLSRWTTEPRHKTLMGLSARGRQLARKWPGLAVAGSRASASETRRRRDRVG